MVDPIWMRPAIGQLFRGGVSYKCYLQQIALVGLFRKRAEDVSIYKYLLKAGSFNLIDEPTDITSFHFPTDGRDYMVEFKGLGDFFQPMNGWSDFLLEQLRLIANPKYLAIADSPASVPIGICVRLGNDFKEPILVDGKIRGMRKTPIDWFVAVLKKLRIAIGYDAKAYIVSDGTPQQLSKLLQQPNVEFVRPGAAISDLLLLSRSRVLLASGASTFAAWGAFLGQMPSATHPGQPLQCWKIEPQNAQYIAEVDCNNIDGEFIRQATVALTNCR